MYTWNARTGYLDTVSERSGLEIAAYILSPAVWLKDKCADFWHNYIALVDVAEENARLRAELQKLQGSALFYAEERAELDRLRELLQLDVLHERPGFGARVIAMRFGPQAVLKTFTVNKGYADGAIVGTPVVTRDGVVGRVLRTAPHAATVLMLTDPGFRLAVISQETRTPGILTGASGYQKRLEVSYVAPNAQLKEGELLITAGVDGEFPKGIPVGIVTNVTQGSKTLFQQVQARPLVNLEKLEDVILLPSTGSAPPLLERLPNPVESAPILPPQLPSLPDGASDDASGDSTNTAP